ncbi:pentapeptide repeat-containing protein [Plantactinospora sp. DSM 117369]
MDRDLGSTEPIWRPLLSINGSALSSANLVDASLYGANLFGTFLDDANLAGAKLVGTDLSDTNLGNEPFDLPLRSDGPQGRTRCVSAVGRRPTGGTGGTSRILSTPWDGGIPLASFAGYGGQQNSTGDHRRMWTDRSDRRA